MDHWDDIKRYQKIFFMSVTIVSLTDIETKQGCYNLTCSRFSVNIIDTIFTCAMLTYGILNLHLLRCDVFVIYLDSLHLFWKPGAFAMTVIS